MIHLKKHHDVAEVQRLIVEENKSNRTEKQKEKTKAEWQVIKNKGNHVHNKMVAAIEEGELVLARTGTDKMMSHFSYQEYGPCPQCFLWLKEEALQRHAKPCVVSKIEESDDDSMAEHEQDDKTEQKDKAAKLSTLIMESRIITGQMSEGPNRLKTEVFATMRRDATTTIAQNDALIKDLGEQWLSKCNRNRLRRAMPQTICGVRRGCCNIVEKNQMTTMPQCVIL
jgi:hypothetical protein